MEKNTYAIKIADHQIGYSPINQINDLNEKASNTDFLIVLFSEGSGMHYIDGIGYPISKRQLHFLFPGQQHYFETNNDTIAQKITISKMLFEEYSCIEELYYIKNNFCPVFKLNDVIFNFIQQEIEGIKRDINLIEIDFAFRLILFRRLDILSSIIKHQAGQYFENEYYTGLNPTIKKLWVLINQHCSIQKNVSWYAYQLCVTPNYLNILCKRILNINASEIISQKIFYEAKQQLRLTNKNIKEIAFDLGFSCPSSFTSFFKKKSGLTPVKYRS
ncbi:Chb operon repressor [Chryseobacterium nakagawai]|uniref:helix-turn-helix domain-containing protein n=1 Tax=Chryseobacterium nakagawai TaxID=1241982 RepID=UPI000F4DAA22|nr:response regulator transcription factor [Chryseobacterium nakagawai]VEH20302.1 Chb operon repressor [Chryseobacterium nakagawai]